MAHLLSCRLLDEACTADETGHSDRAGKGMRPQVGENCVKDTKEEEGHYTNHIRKATRLTGVVVVSLCDIYSSLLSINAYYFDNVVAT